MLERKPALLAFFAGMFVAASAVMLGASTPARAYIGDELGLSPYWNWKTIETDHFRVTFPADLTETAQKEANYLEEAHATLSPLLHWEPWHKTQVLVIDNADLANGLTSAQFRLGLILWATPPDPWFSTTYYDDWLRLLAFHEYTHLLNMDAVRDFYVPLRYFTGDVLLPNTAWPTWMLEGLAVYMETRFTRLGRGRSPFYEMVLRAAVDEPVLDTPKFLTLDKINGDVPYNPSGEAYYLLGYQLINELAHQPFPGGRTADGLDTVKETPGSAGGEDAMGVLSLRSAGRIPYFINGNLENIYGRDWYAVWDEWVGKTRTRAGQQLARIRTQPTTKYEQLTPSEGIATLGPTPSPDGAWLVYTSDTPDRRAGLYALDLIGGKSRRLDDKSAGATASFTPDSRTVIYSAVERYHVYYQFSELEAYDLASGRQYQITHGLRARDPDVSPDGRWITFTLTEHGTTGLAIAPLEREPSARGDGRYRLGEIRKLAAAAGTYDRVSAPRFARDGTHTIYYSVHRNGHPSEELMEWYIPGEAARRSEALSLQAGADFQPARTEGPRELVANGHFNRYPAPAPEGSVYFVSDLTGVDNIYRLPPRPRPDPLAGDSATTTASAPATTAAPATPELYSNVATGVATPAVGAHGEVFAALYAPAGWSIARLDPLSAPVRAADVTIDAPPAPRADERSEDHAGTERHEVSNYSVFPSLWPRQWLFIPEIFPGGAYLQENVAGFDAIDVHSYLAALGYNTQIPKLDWSASYSNRSFGPTLTLYGAEHTTHFSVGDPGVTDYVRKDEFAVQLAYPIPWTYSSLVPAISVGGERIYDYFRDANPAQGDLVGTSPFVPHADLSFAYTNAESSRLAVASEAGTLLSGGVRFYSDSATGQQIWKGTLRDAQYFRLADHTVLSPSIKGTWTSGFDYAYGDADSVVEGRSPGLTTDPLTAIFDPLGIRGYPSALLFSRSAAVAALDLKFPLWRVFRGLGTDPVFLDNLYGFAFAEATKFPSAPNVPWLSSAGGGLTLSTELLLHLPLSLTIEFDQGFQSAYGGKSDLYVTANVGAISL